MDSAGSGGVGVMCNSMDNEDSTPSTSSANGCFPSSESMSPILIFLFFHKAFRNELDELHRLAMAFAIVRRGDIRPLLRRYNFLRSIYKHHSNAEDEIIFPALDVRVKNVAHTYSLEHKGESDLFDHIFELFNLFEHDNEIFQRELASCTLVLQTSVSQHMAKEEEQVFPLLIENFSHEEQAALVWQFLCSIPVDMMAKFLPWLSSSISSEERQDLLKCLSKIVPHEKLLQKVIFAWLKSKNIASVVESCLHNSHALCRFNVVAKKSTHQTDEVNCTSVSTTNRKRKFLYSNPAASDTMDMHPMNDIVLWHNAIRNEWKKISQEAEKIKLSGDSSDLSAFNEKLQFIIEVCIFHSVSEDSVIFPAVEGEFSFRQEHAEEENQFNKFRYLMERIKNAGADSSSASELYLDLCSHAMQVHDTIERHFDNEEIQVLPLVRKLFSFKKQRELLYQSLCMMPLKLIERVLPWFVGSLTDHEAINFINNIKLAAPLTDTALVALFSGWAFKTHSKGICLSSKGVTGIESVQSLSSCASSLLVRETAKTSTFITGPMKQYLEISRTRCRGSSACNDKSCSVSGVNTNDLGLSSIFTVKSFQSSSSSFCAPSLNSSLFSWEADDGSSNGGPIGRPIDTIFQFHKAISKDLEYLDVESVKLSDCDETFLREFIGRFLLLWGLYRAHSNAEDDIVFPAMESKEALHNVSHSYTLDHRQEEKLFEDISCVLSELSLLHQNLQRCPTDDDVLRKGLSKSDRKYKELATKLQGMCRSVRVTLDHHIFREELELWPLFGRYFSVEEQAKLVGRIIGTTGAEVLQSMLPWVTSALTQDEQNKMMDTWKQVTKNTMFNEWLDECWKGSLVSKSQTETFESKISYEVTEIQNLDKKDQMFKPGWKDIFRMNQNELESEIQKAYQDLTLDPRRKAYLVQNLMTSRWIAAQQKLPQAAEGETSKDVPGRSPSFRDPEREVFGCEHYKRNCKLLAACCGKLFACRYCHDDASDHIMDRKATSEMMCMCCLKIQPVGPICIMPSCNGFSMGKYYCNICKFFDDERSVYHCPFCNLCRVGTGLGIDFFHCMTCNCCLGTKSVNHKCLEKSLETNCPICCDFLFTSSATVRALPCGHYMHSACFQAYTCSHYTCPICSKSLGDMAVYFGMLDALLAAEELPDEYKNRCQDILCNDCNEKGTSRFHWLYHKCKLCGSYNTRVIKSQIKHGGYSMSDHQ